ncbi:hypothetical protein ACQP1W_39320 [Spirillospora sp. CA-255316]
MVEGVEGLYEVFGWVARSACVEGCSHCVDPDEDRPLLERPVRELEADVLARYAAKALNTWGGVEEFRYFLPRLLECASEDAFAFPDPPIVFGKLAQAGWTGWADDEREAIEAFMRGWWDSTLERYPSRPDVATVLYSLGTTGVGLGPFLERWGRLETEEAVSHLHEFVLREVAWEGGPRLLYSYWGRRSAAYETVVGWLTGGDVAVAVAEAYEREVDGEAREEVVRMLEDVSMVI